MAKKTGYGIFIIVGIVLLIAVAFIYYSGGAVGEAKSTSASEKVVCKTQTGVHLLCSDNKGRSCEGVGQCDFSVRERHGTNIQIKSDCDRITVHEIRVDGRDNEGITFDCVLKNVIEGYNLLSETKTFSGKSGNYKVTLVDISVPLKAKFEVSKENGFSNKIIIGSKGYVEMLPDGSRFVVGDVVFQTESYPSTAIWKAAGFRIEPRLLYMPTEQNGPAPVAAMPTPVAGGCPECPTCQACEKCPSCPACQECPTCQQTAIVGDLLLNEKKSYTVRGQSLVVELVANDGKIAKFSVNDEVSEALAVGNGDVFKNNIWLMPTVIVSGGAQFVIGSPTFYSSAR